MATAAAATAKGPKEATYAWEGKDKAGKVIRGEMRAGGESIVNATLRRQGILVTKVKKQRAGRGGRVSDKDITLFTRQLATMMKAGVPLLQSFDIVSKGASNPAVAKLLIEIKTEVETGSSLAAAFRKYPLHFDALFCNLVQAGEQAGILESLLDRLATYKEKIQAIKSKIKSALFYPIAILAVAFIITAVIMIFVIPAFKEVFTNFGADLPAPTLMVMAISDWFVGNWYIIFPAIGGAIYGFLEAWQRSRPVQIFMDRLMLRLPVFGSLVRKSTIARWTRTCSTMFAAGVPLVEALDSVGGASGNYVYQFATKQIQSEVQTGTALTVAMQNANVFPSMVIQMVSIGEETGALDSMLSKVADFYEAEVDDAVDALSSLMEPIIMVVLGTLIGGMVIAMYLPIFKIGGAV
jgi:type IV pilus assembly protein PilC